MMIDWPILILGIVSIAYIVNLIATPIISGYYDVDPHGAFPLFVFMMIRIALYLTLIWFALSIGHADISLLIFMGTIFIDSIVTTVTTDLKKSQKSYSSLMIICACLLLLIYVIATIVLTFAIGWDALAIGEIIGLIFALIVGVFLIMMAGENLAKKFDIHSRLEDTGRRLRENKELQIINNRKMNEFRSNLKQWQAEGYSGLKDIIAIKNLDQMEGKFSEVEQKIKKLKTVESTLKKLSQDFPDERAVFESEMESIKKKYKDLSKVDEVEREIKNLKNELNRYYQLKNEILDNIAKVTYE